MGFCATPHTQQCFGHVGIGSNFLIYFSVWGYLASDHHSSILHVWMRPEVLDAIFILPGGFGLTFFGHARGYPWDNESIQHVFLGVISIIGPVLGVWHSTGTHGEPKRNIYPGLVSLIAGYTFLSHPAKENQIFSSLHQGVGFLITSIGACRIIDVACTTYFQDQRDKNFVQGPWNMLSSFFGISAGLVIMTANEEQAALFTKYKINAASVCMGVFAMALIILGYISAVASSLDIGEALETRERYTSIELEEY